MSRFLTAKEKAESTKKAKEEKLCRWCGLDVKRLDTRRRTFCSDECVHEFMIRSNNSYVRQYIGKRDNYTCQICGLDCRGFLRKLWRYVNEHRDRLEADWIHRGPAYEKVKFRELKKQLEIEFFDSYNMEWVNTHGRSTFYDIDHILPVVEGGHQCGEDNLRLLCLGCHRKETKELRKRIAAKAKLELESEI